MEKKRLKIKYLLEINKNKLIIELDLLYELLKVEENVPYQNLHQQYVVNHLKDFFVMVVENVQAKRK
jgi:hypothetical protein